MEFDLARVEKGELALEKFMLSVAEAIDRMIEELRSFEQAHGKSPLALAPSGSARKAGGSAKKASTRTAKHEHRTSILRVDSHDGLASQVEEKKTSKTQQGPEGFAQSNIESRTANLDLGVCPSCGGMVIEGKKGYGCANWRSGCRFVVWKSPICGKVLTPSQMKSLLKKGKTPLIKGFKSKNGKSFSAYLTWEDRENGTLKFEFAKT